MPALSWTCTNDGLQAIGGTGVVYHIGWRECGCCGVLSINDKCVMFGTWSDGEYKNFAQAHEDDLFDCFPCGGDGSVLCRCNYVYDDDFGAEVRNVNGDVGCDRCDGTGYLTCDECNGTGAAPKTQERN